ncbi:hypothetical protein [Nonomuraea sp. NPDC002799]
MNTVRMYHPNIDDGKRIIERPASAVSQHLMAGWLVADPATLEETAVQLLVDGGLPREDAERMLRSQPPGPPPTEQPATSEAPATAGASALPDTEKAPRGRRTRGDE